MKYSCLSLVLCSAFAYAQTAPPPATPMASPQNSIPPTTVVAKVGDKSLTAEEVRKMLANMPADVKQALAQDPKRALTSIFLIDYLNAQAEKDKLAETSPIKEQLEFQRKQTLANAVAQRHNADIIVSEDEQQKRYESDKEKFQTAKIKAIHISYGAPKTVGSQVDMSDPNNPVSKPDSAKKLTEAEAKTKAEELVKQARGGGDFSQLAKDNSDDAASAAKGGDFGTVGRGQQIPEEIKAAIFARKAGEVTDPVRQPNGFYIIKVEEIGLQPYSEVQSQIAQQIRQERFQTWMGGLQKQFEVSIESPLFFGVQPAAAPPKGVPSITPPTPGAKPPAR